MNLLIDTLTPVLVISGITVACIALDYWMRGLSLRRSRIALHSEVQTYLQTRKRL